MSVFLGSISNASPSSLEDVKKIATEHNTSSVSLHPNHKKFVAGSDEDLWVRIYDFDSGEVSGKCPISSDDFSTDNPFRSVQGTSRTYSYGCLQSRW